MCLKPTWTFVASFVEISLAAWEQIFLNCIRGLACAWTSYGKWVSEWSWGVLASNVWKFNWSLSRTAVLQVYHHPLGVRTDIGACLDLITKHWVVSHPIKLISLNCLQQYTQVSLPCPILFSVSWLCRAEHSNGAFFWMVLPSSVCFSCDTLLLPAQKWALALRIPMVTHCSEFMSLLTAWSPQHNSLYSPATKCFPLRNPQRISKADY